MVITGLTRNQVIPNGTEGSNPSLSAKNKGYSVCYTLYFLLIRQQGIRTRTVGFADENSPVDCLKVRG